MPRPHVDETPSLLPNFHHTSDVCYFTRNRWCDRKVYDRIMLYKCFGFHAAVLDGSYQLMLQNESSRHNLIMVRRLKQHLRTPKFNSARVTPNNYRKNTMLRKDAILAFG